MRPKYNSSLIYSVYILHCRTERRRSPHGACLELAREQSGAARPSYLKELDFANTFNLNVHHCTPTTIRCSEHAIWYGVALPSRTRCSEHARSNLSLRQDLYHWPCDLSGSAVVNALWHLLPSVTAVYGGGTIFAVEKVRLFCFIHTRCFRLAEAAVRPHTLYYEWYAAHLNLPADH